MSDPVASFLEREQGLFGDLNEVEEPAAVPQIEVAQVPQANGFVNGNRDSGVDLGALEVGATTPANGRSVSPAASERSDEPVFNSQPDVEPDSVKSWRSNHEEQLKKLDADEEKLMTDLKAQAKKELAEFEKKRAADLESRKKINREKQVEFLKNVDKAESGVLWQRIAKVVEADEKTPKLSTDTDRMRQLLLTGKNGGPKTE